MTRRSRLLLMLLTLGIVLVGLVAAFGTHAPMPDAVEWRQIRPASQ